MQSGNQLVSVLLYHRIFSSWLCDFHTRVFVENLFLKPIEARARKRQSVYLSENSIRKFNCRNEEGSQARVYSGSYLNVYQIFPGCGFSGALACDRWRRLASGSLGNRDLRRTTYHQLC